MGVIKNQKVLIVDYGMGNLRSVYGAFRYFGVEPKVSDDPKDIKTADKIIIPGVGAFGKAVENLKKKGLFYPLGEEMVKGKKIFLGICLGLQVLFEESEESEGIKGFGVIKGKVLNLRRISDKIRIPNMGWAETRIITQAEEKKEKEKEGEEKKGEAREEKETEKTSSVGVLFRGLSQKEYFYYLHSYFVAPEEKSVVTAELVSDNIRFTSSVQKENIFGTQFHPEKSGEKGLKIIENFLKI